MTLNVKQLKVVAICIWTFRVSTFGMMTFSLLTMSIYAMGRMALNCKPWLEESLPLTTVIMVLLMAVASRFTNPFIY
jgi:hypothetical protein